MRMIEKEMTDRFWSIMDRHGNRTWAIDELEWLININHFNFTNDDELIFIKDLSKIRIIEN